MTPAVLFFFELLLFLLSMLTLALGEFASRGLALGVWLASTVASLLGYILTRRALSRDGSRTAPTNVHRLPTPEEGSARLEEKWARTLLYTWRRTNALLLFGAAIVGAWYWLGRT